PVTEVTVQVQFENKDRNKTASAGTNAN
uniref:Uncharacterized protein n=1 Tax=Panagrolaimus sp. JU765 TaxID=591449 RepID=A0AC34Q0H0_9BILA